MARCYCAVAHLGGNIGLRATFRFILRRAIGQSLGTNILEFTDKIFFTSNGGTVPSKKILR